MAAEFVFAVWDRVWTAVKKKKKFGIENGTRHSGLSLLELLLVLTIMIALGGIVVSTLPGLLSRTQVATAASNVPQIDSGIRQNAVLHGGRIGNCFDAMVTGSGSLDGNLPDYLGGKEVFQTATLGPNDLSALHRLGIQELIPAEASAVNATFDSHVAEPVTLTVDSTVCTISPVAATKLARTLFNIDAVESNRYIVMGIGSRSTLVGSGKAALFAEAPVHFSDEQTSSPKAMYARYLIVVELSGTSGMDRIARYVGTFIPNHDGLQSVSIALKQHYDQE